MNKRIGIICALDSELADVIEACEGTQEVKQSDVTFYTGSISGADVVLLKCGVGKVNAARGTQMMIDRFEPSMIINSGIAGGVGEGLAVGDIVISTSLVQHDFDVTAFGHVKGYMCTGEPDDVPTVFTADANAIEAIQSAAEQVVANLDASDGMPRNIHTGIIASGDQFIATAEAKTEIRQLFNAVAAEMEGASIAQTAQYSGIPYAVLRVVSDLADGTAPESYDEFEIKSAKLSAAVMVEAVKELCQA